jgi:lipopolysaccharide/colanic/teichoic acid biosynthesis glycosyltransferase
VREHVPAGRAGAGGSGKRAIDAVVAGSLLILFSPFMFAVALAIRLTSSGPALFRQTRVGFGREPFVILKFRTMHDGADDEPHRAFVSQQLAADAEPVPDQGIFKLTHDERITPIGRFLRRTSVDELPQLINVLKGEMSLVGPRPVLPWEVALFRPKHMSRFTVRPGMTGLWQVSGRSTLTFKEALDLDAEYARRRNARMDARILLKTIPAVVGRRGAW